MDIDIVATPEVIISKQSIALPSTSSSRSSITAVSVPSPQGSHISPVTAISALRTLPDLGLSPAFISGNSFIEQSSARVKSFTRVNSQVSPRPSNLRLSSVYGPPHALTSSMPTSHPSMPSPTTSGLIHPVKVNFSNEAFFSKDYLDGIPIGDSVMFEFNGEFNLYNTTLDRPCSIKDKVHRNTVDPIYIFPVATTNPVWFLACPANNNCRCDRKKHFALNAGHLRSQYFSNAAATIVVIKTTTPQEDMRTVYRTTVVTAN